MSEVFLKIVNMSISASWIVLAVLLLRIVLKKAPKWIMVLLWGIVAIRLISPFSIESVMSLIPSAETINPSVLIYEAEINTGFEAVDNIVNPVISEAVTTIEPENAINTFKLSIFIFSKVWLIGIAILLVYTFISYWRVRRKVRTAVLLRDNVYQSEAVVSPFVLGVMKPKIYIPFNMGKQDEELVLAHEKAHIKRKDYLWKPLGFIILTLHWFNPLMWLGYVLLCRDIEIACDEKVVKELNNEQRADYSQALLTCSVNRRMIAACPLAFGEAGIKERVKSVLNYKKPTFWIIAVSVIAVVITSICLLTNPKTYDASDLDDKPQVLIDTSTDEYKEDTKEHQKTTEDNQDATRNTAESTDSTQQTKLSDNEENSNDTENKNICEHDYRKMEVKNDCVSAGYMQYTCAKCDHSYKGETTQAGHDFMKYLCGRCGKIDSSRDVFWGMNGISFGIRNGKWERQYELLSE